MTRRKLEKLQRDLESLRQRLGSIRPSEVAAIATAVGRVRVNGRHPCYRRIGWPPIPIPDHKNPPTLTKGTAREIINRLEEDIEQLLAEAPEEESE